MRTFKDFLNEVWHMKTRDRLEGELRLRQTWPRTKMLPADIRLRDYEREKINKVSELHSHDIYHVQSKTATGYKIDSFHAYNPDKKQVDAEVTGFITDHPNGTKTLRVGKLSTRPNTIKAHDFYAHLIKNHNMILSSSSQTTGAKKVWERLAKIPGIGMNWFQVQHKPGETGVPGEAITIDPKDRDEFYLDAGDDYDKDDPDATTIGNTRLVAWKKKK